MLSTVEIIDMTIKELDQGGKPGRYLIVGNLTLLELYKHAAQVAEYIDPYNPKYLGLAVVRRPGRQYAESFDVIG